MDSGRGVPDGTENEVPSSTPYGQQQSPQPQSQQPQQLAIAGTAAWEPNDSYMQLLISMGISSGIAKKALYYTKNASTEAAIDWIFENQGADLDTPLEFELQQSSQPRSHFASSTSTSTVTDEQDDDDGLYKMVFVVNAELSMGVGKIAAQVAHAALGLHRILLQHQAKYGENLLNWTEYGETKIVLKGESTEHLIALERNSIDLNLPCYLVHDAGKTQVKSGSTTVLAIFGSNKRVDKVSGLLKLY